MSYRKSPQHTFSKRSKALGFAALALKRASEIHSGNVDDVDDVLLHVKDLILAIRENESDELLERLQEKIKRDLEIE